MPWIIDYEIVLEQMRSQKFKCNYYNSGAFGFADPAGVQHLGWIGPEDPTIRPAARSLTRPIPMPWEPRLAELFVQTWQREFPGRIWAMPLSHWAFEMDFGSNAWMPALIESMGLDPGLLEGRNTAAAIEFTTADAPQLQHFVQRLLEMLQTSDFMLAFVDQPILCTLHHHKQLWWTTNQQRVIDAVDRAAASVMA